MVYSHTKLLRRKIIKFIVLGIATPFTIISQAHAAKTSKESVQYRENPNGKNECSNCMQFIPGKMPDDDGECKVVEGNINPHGWCNAYATKSGKTI